MSSLSPGTKNLMESSPGIFFCECILESSGVVCFKAPRTFCFFVVPRCCKFAEFDGAMFISSIFVELNIGSREIQKGICWDLLRIWQFPVSNAAAMGNLKFPMGVRLDLAQILISNVNPSGLFQFPRFPLDFSIVNFQNGNTGIGHVPNEFFLENIQFQSNNWKLEVEK